MALPGILARLVPVVAGSWPDEPQATCSACAMHRPGRTPAERALQFTSPASCCTYHPALPNFLVGRALRRADEGTVRVLRRMADPRGVIAEGIFPHEGYLREIWRMNEPDPSGWFGRTPMVCPFWDGRCSIYPDRNHNCRTWFCKHEEGARGYEAWRELRDTLHAAESAVAARCIADGHPPVAGDPRDLWVEWYLWTARHAEAIDVAAIDVALAPARAALTKAIAERDGPMPDILIPNVQSHEPLGDGLLFSSYSGYHREVFPASSFAFFARLDGDTPWKTALAAHEDPALDEAVVVRMWRFGLIHRPEARSWKPGWDVGPGLEGLVPYFS
jgi:hypothetical protein